MTAGLSWNLRRKVDKDIFMCSFGMKRFVVACLSFTRSICLQGGNSSLESKPSAFDKLHVQVIGYISCDCLPGVYNYVPFSSALD